MWARGLRSGSLCRKLCRELCRPAPKSTKSPTKLGDDANGAKQVRHRGRISVRELWVLPACRRPSRRETFDDMNHTDQRWLHWFAVLTAAGTLFLIWVGGLVTSHEAGPAVAEWPATY